MSVFRGEPDGAGRRFCLVVSRFNRLVTERLADGARRALERHGVDPGDVDEVSVPGAWELPWAARRVAGSGYDGLVALGCVIRGETPHFDYVCRGATDGLAALAADGVPVGFGLLTCDTHGQAVARAGGEAGNKGEEAAMAVLEMVALDDVLP